MTITEVKQALGDWSVVLRPDTPRYLLDQITPLGHIAVLPGRIDIATTGDNLLRQARYVGVYRGRSTDETGVTLSGAGMGYWLGDEDDKGPVLINATVVASATFPNAIRALLPPAVTEGTLYSVPGTYTGTHQYETARSAISYVTDTFGTGTYPVSWRVNGDGTLDAGRDVDMYVTTPRAILVRKDDAGRDMFLVGLRGMMRLGTDVEDYTTRVVLLAEGDGNTTVSASASLPVVTYKDIHGNTANITRLISEFETSSGNAQARAQLQLNRFTNPRKAVDLSSDDYDIKGEFAVGDSILVFDPDIGFTDPSVERFWKGLPINPVALTCTEMSWPVSAQWTVAFRTGAGVWIDLSDYYIPESGSTTIKVGDLPNSLTNSNLQPVGDRPRADQSIPAAPVFGQAYTGAYQSTGDSDTKAQIQLSWTQPLNQDGSTIQDGDHYEIRYRPNATVAYPATWNDVAPYTWSSVYTWSQPLVPALDVTQWQTLYVPWGVTTTMVQELTPRVVYEFQIRAVDTSRQASPWSSSSAVTAARDNLPPASPAPPEVAGSRIAIQVTHRLGVSTGGTFNLDADLDHLEVHVGGDASFFPEEQTRVGKLAANIGLIRAQVPVVGTFPIEPTGMVYVKVVAVDRTGNRSGASTAATVTAALIDDAHISDLTVSKVTAGTITSDWVMAGTIKTADSGARAVMDIDGFHAFNSDGIRTFNADSAGVVSIIGELSSGLSGQRIVVNPNGSSLPQIRFYPVPDAGTDYASITSDYYGSDAALYFQSSGNASNDISEVILGPGFAYYDVYDTATGLNQGGSVYISNEVAYVDSKLNSVNQASMHLFNTSNGGFATLEANNTAGVKQAGIYFDDQSHIGVTGSFIPNDTYSNNAEDAIICGITSIAVGASSVTKNYGVNSLGTMRMIATCKISSAIVWRLTTVNNTGFVMTLASAVPVGQSCDVYYWGFRTTV